MKTKKRVEIAGLLISIIQILLIINAIPAESYILDEFEVPFGSSRTIDNNSHDFVPKLTGFFMGLFLIKQIGTVSALENSEPVFNCCVETNAGASCQEIGSGLLPNDDPNSCENPLEGRCEENIQCQIGTCVYEEGLSCSAQSPRQECESSGGIWKKEASFEIPECIKGACILGSNIEYVTEKQCALISESEGFEMDFREGVSELEIPSLEQEIQKGACILPGENCRFVTVSECNLMLGSFFKDMLCTNPSLGANCNATEETICVDDEVYFVDSCGNPGNIYDASKINDEEYWNTVSNEKCILDLNNPESVKNCGSCNLFASSKCVSDTENSATYGDNICKDIRCIDQNGNTRLNGEKWCVYDGFVGDGKDTVGSENWISYCNNGEVEVDLCGKYRGQICEQRIIEEGETRFSTASCVVNQAFRCLDDSQNCGENAHCTTKNIDIDSNFKFSACVPKYPRGFDLSDTQDAKSICSIANNECTVIYTKKLFGGWKCTKNCDCRTSEFSEKMNDLCISLGDCGTYVNYEGEGSDNIQVTNTQKVSWTQYKSYADVVEGQFINAAESSNLISPIGSKGIEEFTPESANELVSQIGALGISMGLGVAAAYYAPVTSFPPFGLETTTIAGAEGVSNLFSMSSLASFGIGVVGGLIGSFIGDYIAEAFGITGTAATVVVTASGIAGSSGALLLAQDYGLIALSETFSTILSFSLIAAIAIIALVVLLGWGQTREVKVNFACLPWQPPTGGENCELCNKDPSKPCTIYRCESLGTACRLLNENTENPLCESISQESVPPVITPGEVKTEEYEFQNQESKRVEIRKENGGCIQEFVPVEFTMKTDENSQCKWSLEPTANYEEMGQYSTEGTTYSSEHGFAIEGLSVSILEANNISGDLIQGFTGDLNMYIRCMDYHGNFNLNEYAVNFCVQSGDDTTPVDHSFTSTSPLNEEILAYNTEEVGLTMWINEPAECRYDIVKGKNYDDMESSFSCETGLEDKELSGWPCSANLQDLQNENNFYIKCKDQPWKTGENDSLRNINAEDFEYSLYVSESELIIDSVYVVFDERRTDLSPETTTEISGGGNSFSVEIGVETSGGSHNGVALCSYESNGNFVPFFNSNAKIHEQEFLLLNGNHNVSIKCVDPSGNEAAETRSFALNVDSSPPKITRVYHSSGNLNLITDEQAKCYASFDNVKQCGFNIDEVESVTSTFTTEHSLDWDTEKIYYIKCEDLFGKTNPTCAIKVNPSLI